MSLFHFIFFISIVFQNTPVLGTYRFLVIYTLKYFWSNFFCSTDSFRWGFGGYYFLKVLCIPVKTKFASFLLFVGHVNIDWYKVVIWWRHQMDTFTASLALCAGNSPIIKRKSHLSVVWNWYHFVAIAILHQPRPTDSADISMRLQPSSIPPMHGGFLLISFNIIP